MNCFFCHLTFSSARIPRVLIDCGHTVCESCLISRHSNNSVCCPECKQINFGALESFPKNLTLLNLQQTNSGCSVHRKPYEAYCEKDKELLCVSCILEQKHKSHKISSIEQTVTQDKEILAGSSERIKGSIEELRGTSGKIKQSVQNSAGVLGRSLNQIESFYNKIRLWLNTKEQQAKSRLDSVFTSYMNKLDGLQKEIGERIEFLIDLYKMYQDISVLRNVDYLSETNKRIFIMENARGKPLKVDLQPPLLSFGRTEEIRSIQVYFQQMVESQNAKKPQGGRLKKTISTTHRNQKEKSEKKDGVLVLELDLNDKYRKHQETKKTMKRNLQLSKYNSCEPEDNLSEIKMKSSQSSVMNRSVEEIFKRDLTLSIKDYEYSLRCNDERIYHLGGVNSVRTEVFDCNSMEGSSVGFMLERARFQAVPLSPTQILVIGGNKIDNTIVFDTEKLSSTPLDFKLSTSRQGYSAATINNQLFVMGGSENKAPTNLFEEYNLKSLSSPPRKLPGLISCRTDFSSAVGYDGKIYVAGGIGSKQTTLQSCERFDVNKGRWESLGNMNMARSHFALVSLPDGVYAIGGSDGTNALRTVEKLEYLGETWKVIAEMSEERLNHTGCAINDGEGILVFGGHNSSVLKSVEYYSVVNQSWKAVGNMLRERYMHQSVVMKCPI